MDNMPDTDINNDDTATINSEGLESGIDFNTNGLPKAPDSGIKEGTKIGNFSILRKLGVGGMGEVWLARQDAMDRNVAVKVLSPICTQDESFVKRFLKEARMSGKMEHPNIVAAYDAGFDNGFYYLAMSYVKGKDLKEKLKDQKTISEHEGLETIRKIASALKYAWDKFKILHRDIKPSNIMIDEDGEPKLMDMGISKMTGEDSSMTMTGMIVGTPHYISPEQAMADKSLDCRSDIYSLGASLYHILTGSPPYEATTAMGVLSKHITDPFPPPREKNPEISEKCSALLEIMMAKERHQRQTSWDEVLRDIDLVLAGEFPETALPSGELLNKKTAGKGQGKTAQGTGSRKPVVIAGVVAVVLVISASVIFLTVYKSAEKPGNKREPSAANAVPNVVSTPPVADVSVFPDTTENSDKVPDVPVAVPKVDNEAKEQWQIAADYARQAIKNSDNYDRAIANFSKIKQNFSGSKYELKADIEIGKLEQSKEKAVENLMNKLEVDAGKMIAAKKFDKAAELYREYSGKFENETEPDRSALAEKCMGAQKNFKQMLQDISNSIVNNRFEKANFFLKKASADDLEIFFPDEFKKIKSLLADFNKIEKSGDLGSSSIPQAKALFEGMAELKRNDYPKAVESFRNTGLLADSLIANTELIEKKTFELNAEKSLRDLVLEANLVPGKLLKYDLLDQLKERKLTKKQAELISKELKNYLKKYEKTRFVESKKEFIEILLASAKARLDKQMLLPENTENAIGNINSATNSALDLLLSGNTDKQGGDKKNKEAEKVEDKK
jgi:serine/threonine-protein kinase